MIKNVLNLIDYIETTEILYIIIFLELLEICITITSIFFFFFRYYSNIEIKVIFKNFKKTDIKNQLFTIWFTLRYAIPNRILINNT